MVWFAWLFLIVLMLDGLVFGLIILIVYSVWVRCCRLTLNVVWVLFGVFSVAGVCGFG